MAAAINQLLSCTICTELYDQGTHLPRVTPCGHTFCDLCIRVVQNSTKTCSVCRSPIGANELSANFALLALVSEVPQLVRESQHDLIEKQIDDAFEDIQYDSLTTAEGRFNSVIDLAEATVKQKACARVGLGNLYRKAEKYEKAIDILEGTLQLEGIGEEASKAHLELGIVFRLIKRYHAALDHLNPLIEDRTDPSYWEAKLNRGLLYIAMGMLRESIEDLKAVLNDPKPDEACTLRAQLELGRAYYLLKDYENAIAFLNPLKRSLNTYRKTQAVKLLAMVEKERSRPPSTCCLIS